MINSSKGTADTARVWKRAAYGGAVVAVVILVAGQSSVLTAVLAGLLAFLAGGYLGGRMRSAIPASETADAPRASMPERASEAETGQEHQAEDVALADGQSSEQAPLVKLAKVLPGELELAARKGTWRYEGNGAAV